jgi:hypothetical protein
LKILKFMPVFFLLLVALAACASDPSNALEEGFEFSEEEAAEVLPEEMVFSEEEAINIEPEPGFDFTEDNENEPMSETGFDFTEDEPIDPIIPLEKAYPPAGISNWIINHDEGTVNCESLSFPFEKSPPEQVTIDLGVDGSVFFLRGMGEAPEIFFVLEYSGEFGTQYYGVYTVPVENVDIKYEMAFTNLTDPNAADFIMGNIFSTSQGCKVYRSFSGTRVD